MFMQLGVSVPNKSYIMCDVNQWPPVCVMCLLHRPLSGLSCDTSFLQTVSFIVTGAEEKV